MCRDLCGGKATKKIIPMSVKYDVTWRFMFYVKSAKRHLKCVFDEASIVPTFEEFTTVLCQVEPAGFQGRLYHSAIIPMT